MLKVVGGHCRSHYALNGEVTGEVQPVSHHLRSQEVHPVGDLIGVPLYLKPGQVHDAALDVGSKDGDSRRRISHKASWSGDTTCRTHGTG